jgi:hypothetical protein
LAVVCDRSHRTVIGGRALDDPHMTWIAAEVAAEEALAAWFEAAAPDRAAAYVAYQAALAREEAAALDLQRLGDLIRPHEDRVVRANQ